MRKNIIYGLIFIVIAILILYFGVINIRSIIKNLNENCKTCSIFEDCPYTDEELLEQEYGNDPYCNDMGIYEMQFKIAGVFYGGLATIFLLFGMYSLKKWQR